MNLSSRLIPFKDFYDKIFREQFPYTWQFFCDENGFIVRRLERKDSNKGVFYGAVLRHNAPVFLIDSRVEHFLNGKLIQKNANLSEIFKIIYSSTNKSLVFCEELADIIDKGNRQNIGWYYHDSITGYLYYKNLKGHIQVVQQPETEDKTSRLVIHAKPYPKMENLFKQHGYNVLFIG